MSAKDPSEPFETVPTFFPTLEEMRDFDGYLRKLYEAGADKAGLCKVVPPKEWDWKPDIEVARKMRVRNPILQCVTGRSGMYSVCNVVKKNQILAEYETLALKAKDAPADFETNEGLWDAERRFWKSLTTTAKPPLYGSDVEGSLFGNADVPFNINTLPCLLKSLGVRLPGITNPMMYVGMWRSFFPFHAEDVNMFSINIMHLGAPKFWYGIPPAETNRMINLAKATWPEETCPELMRHKTKLFSPTRLKQAAVPFVRGVQRPGDIMITWPSSFHGGFNAGFNVAEAVNFVPASLFDLYISRAKNAGFCKCRPDSVRLDINWLQEQVRLNPDLRPSEYIAPVPRVKREKRRRECLDVKATIVSIVDGEARLHRKNSSKKEDLWVSLRDDRLRLPVAVDSTGNSDINALSPAQIAEVERNEARLWLEAKDNDSRMNKTPDTADALGPTLLGSAHDEEIKNAFDSHTHDMVLNVSTGLSTA